MKFSRLVLLVFASLLSLHLCDVEGVDVVVPQGLESVNGSSVNMGCTSSLVDSDGVLVCESRSYLVDGCFPDIDTSTSDWASQLVTVRRSDHGPGINFRYVLLTFGFDTAVSLTGIEIDLFLCPDWGIGAPSIYVYLNEDYNLANTNILNLPFVLPDDNSLQSSCDSLSTVTFSGGSLIVSSYHAIHILVVLSAHPSIEWVHVGEVRFIGITTPECLALAPTTTVPPSSTPLIAGTSIPPTSSLLSSPTTGIPTVSIDSSSDTFTPSISSIGKMTTMTTDQFSSTMSLSLSETVPFSPSPATTTGPSSSTAGSSTTVPSPVTTSSVMSSTAVALTSSSTTILRSSLSPSRPTVSSTSILVTTSPTKMTSVLEIPATSHTFTQSQHTTSATEYSKSSQATIAAYSSMSSTTTTVYPSPPPPSPPPLTPHGVIFTTHQSSTPAPPILDVLTTHYTSSAGQEDTTTMTTVRSRRPKQTVLPLSTSPAITSPPAHPGKDEEKNKVLSLAVALTSVIFSVLAITLAITSVFIVLYKKSLKRNSRNLDPYIEIGPLAPTRMDVPEEEEEFGVHKVTLGKDQENGNIYETAK